VHLINAISPRKRPDGMGHHYADWRNKVTENLEHNLEGLDLWHRLMKLEKGSMGMTRSQKHLESSK
jgi:UDP-N-acetyl-D-mannosaminuronic acid transferase (WecB/TagA/CpsF family)